MIQSSYKSTSFYFERPSLLWGVALIPVWLFFTGTVIYYLLLLLEPGESIQRVRALFILSVATNGVISYLLAGYSQLVRSTPVKNHLLDLILVHGDSCIDFNFNRYIIDENFLLAKGIQPKQLKRLGQRDIYEVLERYKRHKHEEPAIRSAE
ncbi:hypothetical protein [Brevibacillus sp. 179-C9.3 HS]|uniref:hypothetical protein n=1 Tax=unclassified Brevibacillus TaxID=2684853 RepID=UPI0039A2A64E